MATRIKHLDRRSLRALAHPLRMQIVGSLRGDGPATATVLAERLGESSGLTSYHVRVLASHGFVEEAPDRGTGRERWWQAAQDMTSWRAEEFRDAPDERAAEEWLTGYASRRGMEWLDEWLTRRSSASPEWVAASDASDYTIRLTPTQLRAMLDDVHAVIARYLDAALSPSADTEGAEAEQVRLLLYAFPRLGDGSDATPRR